MLRQGHLARRRGRVLRPPRVYGPGLSVGYRSVLSGRRRLHEECRLLRRRLCPQLLRVRPELLRAGRNVQERRLRPLHDAVRLEVLRRRRVLRIAEAEPLLQNRLRRVSGSEERRWRLLRPSQKCCFTATKASCCGPAQKCHKGSCTCPKEKPVECGPKCCKAGRKCCDPSKACCGKGEHCCDETCCPKKQPCCETAAGKRCCSAGQHCANIAGAPGNKNCCPTARIATPNGVPVCCPTGTVPVSNDNACCPPGNPNCCVDFENELKCLGNSFCVNGACLAF